MKVKVKEQYKDRVVGFNGSGLPLGKRTDLKDLAEIAIKSNDKILLELFEELPTIAEIEKSKSKNFLERTDESANPKTKGNGQ